MSDAILPLVRHRLLMWAAFEPSAVDPDARVLRDYIGPCKGPQGHIPEGTFCLAHPRNSDAWMTAERVVYAHSWR